MTEENGYLTNEQLLQFEQSLDQINAAFTRDAILPNASMEREPWLKHSSHNGQRNYYAQLGYNEVVQTQDIWSRYRRDSIARSAVDAIPEDTWKRPPRLVEVDADGNEVEESEFVAGFEALVDRLKLWSMFTRLDKLARLGRFGVMVIGFNDSPSGDATAAQQAKDAVTTVDGPEGIIWVSIYGEIDVLNIRWENEKTSKRYRQPTSYQIQSQVNDEQGGDRPVIAPPQISETFHHSRVIHVAEGNLSSDFFGHSIIEQIWNDLDDLTKIKGGGAEATWRLISQKIINRLAGNTKSLRTKDDPTGELAVKRIQQKLDDFIHNLSSVVLLQGSEGFEVVSGDPVDPSGLFDIIISVLAAVLRMPKRLLIGAEAGELASSLDEQSYASTIAARQSNYAEPFILRPFLNRLIEYGALPKPEHGYKVGRKNPLTGRYEWPPYRQETGAESATTASSRATAMKTAQEAQGLGAKLTDNDVRQFGGQMPIEGGDELPVATMAANVERFSPAPDVAKTAERDAIYSAFETALLAQYESADLVAILRASGNNPDDDGVIDRMRRAARTHVQPLADYLLDSTSLVAALNDLAMQGADEIDDDLPAVQRIQSERSIREYSEDRALALLDEIPPNTGDTGRIDNPYLDSGLDEHSQEAVALLLLLAWRKARKEGERSRAAAIAIYQQEIRKAVAARAAFIANYEAARTYNAGLYFTAAAWSLLGKTVYKVWLRTRASQPRPDHLATVGERRRLNERFSNGDYWSQERPGCQCGIAVEVVDG